MKDKFDIVIVGGGVAGAVAAWTFQRSGLSVALVDERNEAHAFFRAERISAAVGKVMKGLDLFDSLDAVSLDLATTAIIKGGKVENITHDNDFSALLGSVVKDLREKMVGIEGIEMIFERAGKVENSSDRQVLHLESGRELDCKLIVVATGGSTAFLKSLGITRSILSKNHSSTFGFDIKPGEGFKLPADSITVRICQDGADYMNIFPTLAGGYRVNLFTFWGAGSDQQRAFATGDADAILKAFVPQLKDVIGEWSLDGDIDCGSVSVMKSDGYQDKSGMVLIGDAYGRICPCGGKGVNKTLNDILALKELVPKWVSEDVALTPECLNAYYQDDHRMEFEELVFTESVTLRNRMLKKDLYWSAKRFWYDTAPFWLKEAMWKLKAGKKDTTGVGGH